MNAAERLNLVNDTTNALKLTRTKLKAAASKKPLLHKPDATSAAQHTDLAQAVPEPAEPTVPSSEVATNDSNGWVDPANNSASRPAVLDNTSATTAAKNSGTTTSTDKTAKRNTNGASTAPITEATVAQKQQIDKTSVVRPEANRSKKADRSKKTAATARRTAEAALAAVLAGEDYSKQAGEHAQAETETESMTVLPDEAFAKAENVAQQDEAAVRKATTLRELKTTAAQTAKTRYQAEAATAHTEALRLAERADKADNGSELPQAERNADKVRIQEIMRTLVVMDQQRVKAETEAEDAKL
uniref:Uncharacterized protein n=1 Tax=Globisporangium ultimum (strain ATCC 200006 / CBS 805.95 / DAOM BR144) TaxID=431595 RepID=K3WHA7_GLOUD